MNNVNKLIQQLRSEEDSYEKSRIVKNLGDLGPSASLAVPALIDEFERAIKGDDPDLVTDIAAETLRIDSSQTTMAAVILDQCQHQNVGVQERALDILRQLMLYSDDQALFRDIFGSVRVFPIMLTLFKDQHQESDIRAKTVGILIRCCPTNRTKEIAQLFIDQMESQDPEIRNASIWGIEQCESVTMPPITSIVHTLTKHRDDETQEAICHLCKALGPKARFAATNLVDVILDNAASSLVQIVAAEALIAVAPDDERIIPSLEMLLQHELSQIRQYISTVLGTYRGAAAKAIPKLQQLLEDEERDVREAASEAIDNITDAAP